MGDALNAETHHGAPVLLWDSALQGRAGAIRLLTGWAPTPAEAALLATGEAIVVIENRTPAVYRCDALPHDLDVYTRAQERAELLKAAKEALRKSAPRSVKISRRLAKAKGLT